MSTVTKRKPKLKTILLDSLAVGAAAGATAAETIAPALQSVAPTWAWVAVSIGAAVLRAGLAVYVRRTGADR